ncbi:hypothetical protein NQZ68_032949 [Dissostichus eleginoides]|nr:hypothetical protein NQZ68_032949 [Dissostichus eleginoides]
MWNQQLSESSQRLEPLHLPLRSLLAPSVTERSGEAPGPRLTLHIAVCWMGLGVLLNVWVWDTAAEDSERASLFFETLLLRDDGGSVSSQLLKRREKLKNWEE